MRITVCGYPSRYGGADTELHHQIICWLRMGVEVSIVPFYPPDANQLKLALDQKGCCIHSHQNWAAVEGTHAIGFCSAEFLKLLPEIRKHALSTTFVNCMTWNFEMELQRQGENLIDVHLYQTDHGRDMVGKRLEILGHAYNPIRFTPYFHADFFPFRSPRPGPVFKFGRISREDTDKFNASQIEIYRRIEHRPKKGIILGWGRNALQKCGQLPIEVCGFGAGSLSQSGFYAFADAVVMTTDTFENLPRVGLEAMASGSVLIVDNRGGWQVLVDHGKTGYLAEDPDDMLRYCEELAHDRDLMHSMALAARDRLDALWGYAAASQSWTRVFEALDQCRKR
jgi:glycosyltransferase involved in cell wall biosynthesis